MLGGPSNGIRTSAGFRSSILAATMHDDGDMDRVHKEVSRRVALVMAAATVAAGSAGLSPAEAMPLTGKVESLEYENLTTVNTKGAPEKHLPNVSATAKGGVTVVVPHVMDPEKPHYIEYVWLKDEDTGKIVAAQKFEATDASPPTLTAKVPAGTKVRALLFCNLHGLWQGDPVQV